tara:strand:- start:10023 stop:10394 length:372 start_codon:yes stop_codon:yes gene_type:complete
MIFGKLEIGKTLETHRGSYVLAGISAISTHRPFFSTGLVVGGLSTTFALGFRDILWPGELLALSCITVASVAAGMSIGQLRLVSRDLRGSPMADAVYGTYPDLNRRRREIADAIGRTKSRGAS